MINLNPAQQEVVTHKDGSLLVLAGAGSGKTRSMVERTAFLIEQGISPDRILVVTFTNKAASELKERLSHKVKTKRSPVAGTFHSLACLWLRTSIYRLGFKPNFHIYDEHEQSKVMKIVFSDLGIKIDKEKNITPNSYLERIGFYKSQGISYKFFSPEYNFDIDMHPAWKAYQEYLFKRNTLDFDDILLFMAQILKGPMRDNYANLFDYIMVDESQDLNIPQYEIVKYLAHRHKNLVLVGDVDQSVYSFRGADYKICMDFEVEFKAKKVKLEHNYRSCPSILNVANSIILKNKDRFDKILRPTHPDNQHHPETYTVLNDWGEAELIANYVQRCVSDGKYKYSDFTILYRVNSYSRVLEQVLIGNSIPYIVYGGVRFYDRKEVKDAIAYLKVVNNPKDDISLLRIINVPKRGIGDTSMEKFRNLAKEQNLSLWEYLSITKLSPALEKKVRPFMELIETFIGLKDSFSVHDLLDKVLVDSGYKDALIEIDRKENRTFSTRMGNIESLLETVTEWKPVNLEEYLEKVSLFSDTDTKDSPDCVKLMTIHSSKGLEFPVVFIVGMAEGILPHNLCSDPNAEEERRLMYVAVTRGMWEVHMTYPQSRTVNDKIIALEPSRFLKEF